MPHEASVKDDVQAMSRPRDGLQTMLSESLVQHKSGRLTLAEARRQLIAVFESCTESLQLSFEERNSVDYYLTRVLLEHRSGRVTDNRAVLKLMHAIQSAADPDSEIFIALALSAE